MKCTQDNNSLKTYAGVVYKLHVEMTTKVNKQYYTSDM